MTDNFRDPVFDISAWPARDGALVIATARQSGVYISHDAGKSWSPAWNKGLAASIGIITRGAGVSRILAGVAGGVLCSADNGKRWQYQPLGTPPPLVSSLAVVSNDAEWPTLIAGTHQDGLFRSCDGGTTWKSCNTGVFIPRISALHSLGHRHAIAAAECCVFETRDGAESWSDLDSIEVDGTITAVGGNGDFLVIGSDAGDVVAFDARWGIWNRIGNRPEDGELLALTLRGDGDQKLVTAITSKAIRQLRVDSQDRTPQEIEVAAWPFQQTASCGAFYVAGQECLALTGHSDGSVNIKRITH